MAFDNGMIDLRSDTVTQPTPEMRKAMAEAVVGDDVYCEDPTVNNLQETAAELMGKEAGLFVPSGTMANLIAVLAHCQRGDEAIMGNLGHTFLHEVGGMSALGGVFANTIPNQNDGTLSLEDIRNSYREEDVHHPESRLVILENTQNACGGIPLSVDYMRLVGELAHQLGMKLHVDGARIFNATVALNTTAENLAAAADSVMFCLSKGLCAPVGSVLCGSSEFIARSRKIRKQLGGGMRQAGILAAAGLVALKSMVGRLGEDHVHARQIADGLKELPGIEFHKGYPQTNMVFIHIKSNASKNPEELRTYFANKGILFSFSGPEHFRLVTHYWINDADVTRIVNSFKEALV
ncbi:MAG: low-specificity L-threonine aldolase [Pelolinea sp.]|nr:low-specificity L-threonine aldolase [Pelolinea sp.]